jgi:hypothetical protein
MEDSKVQYRDGMATEMVLFEMAARVHPQDILRYVLIPVYRM